MLPRKRQGPVFAPDTVKDIPMDSHCWKKPGKRLLPLLLLLVGIMQAGILPLGAQVRFETGSTDILHRKALQTGKPVFINLYAEWCQPCRTMEREVFSDREVGEFINERFVAARYNVDRTTGRKLMERYGSGSIPLCLIFSPEGELLGRITGAFPAAALLKNLRTILDRQQPGRSGNDR